MKKKPDNEFLDRMSKDPGNWRGPFYYNPRDPRVIVPKLYSSMGWTFNFASPYILIGFSIITVFLILIIVL